MDLFCAFFVLISNISMYGKPKTWDSWIFLNFKHQEFSSSNLFFTFVVLYLVNIWFQTPRVLAQVIYFLPLLCCIWWTSNLFVTLVLLYLVNISDFCFLCCTVFGEHLIVYLCCAVFVEHLTTFPHFLAKVKFKLHALNLLAIFLQALRSFPG